MFDDDLVLSGDTGDTIDDAIDHGDKLLGLDQITWEDFQPRNALITVRRIGALKDDMAGSILLPEGTNKFDVAEVLKVGRGTPTDTGIGTDTEDVKPGDLILMKTESQPQPGVRAHNTLKFHIGGMAMEIVNQHDILAIITINKETTDAEN